MLLLFTTLSSLNGQMKTTNGFDKRQIHQHHVFLLQLLKGQIKMNKVSYSL